LNITNVIGIYNVWIQRSTTVVILILLDLNDEHCPEYEDLLLLPKSFLTGQI